MPAKTFDLRGRRCPRASRSRASIDANEARCAPVPSAARSVIPLSVTESGRHCAGAEDPGPRQPGEAEGSGDLRPAVRLDDLVRADPDFGLCRSWKSRRPSQASRQRLVRCSTDVQAGLSLSEAMAKHPDQFPAADGQHDRGRRDGRFPRRRVGPHRQDVRGGRGAAGENQVRADVPGHRADLLAADGHRRDHLHRPDLREDVQASSAASCRCRRRSSSPPAIHCSGWARC